MGSMAVQLRLVTFVGEAKRIALEFPAGDPRKSQAREIAVCWNVASHA